MYLSVSFLTFSYTKQCKINQCQQKNLRLSLHTFFINPFVLNAPFLYPLKKVRFSNVLRGQRKSALGKNGLIIKGSLKSSKTLNKITSIPFLPLRKTNRYR